MLMTSSTQLRSAPASSSNGRRRRRLSHILSRRSSRITLNSGVGGSKSSSLAPLAANGRTGGDAGVDGGSDSEVCLARWGGCECAPDAVGGEPRALGAGPGRAESDCILQMLASGRQTEYGGGLRRRNSIRPAGALLLAHDLFLSSFRLGPGSASSSLRLPRRSAARSAAAAAVDRPSSGTRPGLRVLPRCPSSPRRRSSPPLE